MSGRYTVAVERLDRKLALRAENLVAVDAIGTVRFPVRRAWRSFLGEHDGDTEDEDEFVADVKRQKSDVPLAQRKYHAHAILEPRGGPHVSVVATSDLHRHHDERYLCGGTLSLAEWFESPHAPPHVDLLLLAGDLGLERECECTSRPHRSNDEKTLRSWRHLLARMLAAKPTMHVVIVGGK